MIPRGVSPILSRISSVLSTSPPVWISPPSWPTSTAIYAVQYALLIISEAARKLGAHAESLAPGQPWPDIRGIGNLLRHE